MEDRLIREENMFVFDRVDKGFDKASISHEEEIELNKIFSQTMDEIRSSINTGTCLYCGKRVSSFCNSHNIPKFCLKNISSNGVLTGPNAIIELPPRSSSIGKAHPGINESGTFSLICRECDSTIFQDYENPENYSAGKIPTQKMLAEIAMKNYLKFIYKRKVEVALIEHTISQVQKHKTSDPFSRLFMKEQEKRLEVSRLDLDTYGKDYREAKRVLGEDAESGYYVIYYRLLNYVVPLSIQAPILVSIDLEGEVVNDVFTDDPKYELSDLHVCVFPLEDTTAIILFVKDGDTRYRKFRRQFRKLDEESKLGVINYMIFLYSEDYFLSGSVQDKIDLNVLNEVANTTPVLWGFEPVRQTSVLSEKFNLSSLTKLFLGVPDGSGRDAFLQRGAVDLF